MLGIGFLILALRASWVLAVPRKTQAGGLIFWNTITGQKFCHGVANIRRINPT
jgi:hypothetical protein